MWCKENQVTNDNLIAEWQLKDPVLQLVGSRFWKWYSEVEL